MQTITAEKDANGNTCFFRSADAGFSVLLLHSANVARYPRHEYPVLCLRPASEERLVTRPDGSVEFSPTSRELRGLFDAVKAVHSDSSVRIAAGEVRASDPTGHSRDALVSVVRRDEGFMLRLVPTAHTRARWLADGSVEYMPRSSELVMLAQLLNVLEPSVRVTLAMDFTDKPESWRTRWANINAERCRRQKGTRTYRRNARTR